MIKTKRNISRIRILLFLILAFANYDTFAQGGIKISYLINNTFVNNPNAVALWDANDHFKFLYSKRKSIISKGKQKEYRKIKFYCIPIIKKNKKESYYKAFINLGGQDVLIESAKNSVDFSTKEYWLQKEMWFYPVSSKYKGVRIYLEFLEPNSLTCKIYRGKKLIKEEEMWTF